MNFNSNYSLIKSQPLKTTVYKMSNLLNIFIFQYSSKSERKTLPRLFLNHFTSKQSGFFLISTNYVTTYEVIKDSWSYRVPLEAPTIILQLDEHFNKIMNWSPVCFHNLVLGVRPNTNIIKNYATKSHCFS